MRQIIKLFIQNDNRNKNTRKTQPPLETAHQKCYNNIGGERNNQEV